MWHHHIAAGGILSGHAFFPPPALILKQVNITHLCAVNREVPKKFLVMQSLAVESSYGRKKIIGAGAIRKSIPVVP